MPMNNYEELANAIILQAVKDYRDALGMLAKNPNSISAVVRQIKKGHILQIKSGLIHGNCQKTVGLSSLISSDYKKKKLPMQIKTQAVS